MNDSTQNPALELRVRISKDLFWEEQQSFSLETEFSAGPGITILFGPSGAGKTTLLHCIAGILRPDSGEIAFGGQCVFRSTSPIDLPMQQRALGYVFQALALFPHLSIRQNVSYGLSGSSQTIKQQLTDEILESFHIRHLARRIPGGISGGERQRVALARSLVTKPKLLLLDEPLSALDEKIKTGIIDDLLRWNESHQIPVVYVTHSQHEAFALGKRVLVLEAGKITNSGTLEKVFGARPVHTYL